MIEKFKHGSEVSSERLNEIIDVLNRITKTYSDVQILADTADDKLSAVNATLESINSQLSTIPEISKLYAELLLAKDSVDWYEITHTGEEELTLLESDLLTQNFKAERLRVLRGPNSLITLTTPPVRDKQIIIAYDVINGQASAIKLYMDFYDQASKSVKRILLSTNEDATITMEAPELSFVYDSGNNTYLEIKQKGDNVLSKFPLNGPAGATGAQGPQGVPGPKGDKGEKGDRGEKGFDGKPGQTPTVSIKFASDIYGNSISDSYSEQYSYVGIKFTTDTQDTGYKYFPTKSKTYYPKMDSEGYLTFSTEQPTGDLKFYVKGDKGNEGPTGPAPRIKFKKRGTIIEPTYEEASSDNRPTYIYDAVDFLGDPGPQGKDGNQGDQGPMGPAPTLSDIEVNTYSLSASEEPKGYGNFIKTALSGDYKLNIVLGIPKGKQGDPGEKGESGKAFTISRIVNTYSDLPTLTESNVGTAYAVGAANEVKVVYLWTLEGEPATLKWVNMGTIQGEKGEKGEKGENGAPGAAAFITNATAQVTNNRPGNPTCVVEPKGDASNRSFNFVFDGIVGPQGELTPILFDETITTLEPGTPGRVVNIGESPTAPKLKFYLPKGEKGDTGPIGRNVKLNLQGNSIVWAIDNGKDTGEDDWRTLLTIDNLKGEKGDRGNRISVTDTITTPSTTADDKVGDLKLHKDTLRLWECVDKGDGVNIWQELGYVDSPAKDYVKHLTYELKSNGTQLIFTNITNNNQEEEQTFFIPKFELREGTTNGTINFDGTDIKVHGLGSNAFSSKYIPSISGDGNKFDISTALGSTRTFYAPTSLGTGMKNAVLTNYDGSKLTWATVNKLQPLYTRIGNLDGTPNPVKLEAPLKSSHNLIIIIWYVIDEEIMQSTIVPEFTLWYSSSVLPFALRSSTASKNKTCTLYPNETKDALITNTDTLSIAAIYRYSAIETID